MIMPELVRAVKKVTHVPRVFLGWAKSAGWRVAVTCVVYRIRRAFGFQLPASVKLKPRRAQYPLMVRLGGSSDMDVFRQIFLEEEYACLRNISFPRLILDLGANVGYSSAYFLSCFPTATVVAVEPDPSNFELCRKNLAPYADRAMVVLGAVWSKRCQLVLSRFGDGHEHEWATQVHERLGCDNEATVEAWDVSTLIEQAGGTNIDLLKVDIERSELEIFGDNSSSWLPKVENICIELHGADCRNAFFRALEDIEYNLEISGELTICRNLHRKTPSR
jgi:FkbM family methyltransferase